MHDPQTSTDCFTNNHLNVELKTCHGKFSKKKKLRLRTTLCKKKKINLKMKIKVILGIFFGLYIIVCNGALRVIYITGIKK